MAPELRDEWVSSHQVPEETRGQQWTGEMGQQAVIPEGEEQEAEVAQTQLDPSSMATTWSQSSRGRRLGLKRLRHLHLLGQHASNLLEDSTPGGKGSGLSTPKQPPNEKGSSQKGTTSSKTNKKGSTEGTWLGVGDGS